jgi:hypothetical protein
MKVMTSLDAEFGGGRYGAIFRRSGAERGYGCRTRCLALSSMASPIQQRPGIEMDFA